MLSVGKLKTQRGRTIRQDNNAPNNEHKIGHFLECNPLLRILTKLHNLQGEI